MSTPTDPTLDTGVESLRCARHPGTETLLRCGRCETPICPKCVVQSPVGMRCPDCGQVKRIGRAAQPTDFGRAAALGVATATLGSLILFSIMRVGLGLELIGLAATGFATGHAVLVGANHRRGRPLALLAIGCLLAGYALGPALAALLGGRPMPIEAIPLVLLRPLFSVGALLGLGVGALLAWMRTR